VAPAVVAVAIAAIGCSTSTTTTPGTTSAPGSAPAPAGTGVAGSTPPGAACGWPNKADKETLNVAYPDTAATYWSTNYVLAPGERLEIHGRFPEARYASFITYGPAGGANAVLTDRDIEPDPGSTNPFRDGGPAGGRYTIQVRGDTTPQPNAISAVATTTTTTTTAAAAGTAAPAGPGTTAPVPNPAVDRASLLGSGTPGAPGVVGGTVIYRVYLSKAKGDPSGGGLPDIRVVGADGTTTDVPTCPNPHANPAAEAIINANGPATSSPAPSQPVFLRPKAGTANLYPNPDNVYVVTILHHTPGTVAVVRGKAPTFPDTAKGAAVTGGEQVRYWSLCTDEYRKPYPVSFCVADQDVALDTDGNYTFVVSTPEDRPANATAANGITWLEWGSTSVDNLLLLRHMLAASGFAESAINLEPGSLATTTMGAYAPRGVYCASTTFAAGGPAACPLP
jgi:hypothetical protein